MPAALNPLKHLLQSCHHWLMLPFYIFYAFSHAVWAYHLPVFYFPQHLFDDGRKVLLPSQVPSCHLIISAAAVRHTVCNVLQIHAEGHRVLTFTKSHNTFSCYFCSHACKVAGGARQAGIIKDGVSFKYNLRHLLVFILRGRTSCRDTVRLVFLFFSRKWLHLWTYFRHKIHWCYSL